MTMTATSMKTLKTNAKCTLSVIGIDGCNAYLTSFDKFHQVGYHDLWPLLSNSRMSGTYVCPVELNNAIVARFFVLV